MSNTPPAGKAESMAVDAGYAIQIGPSLPQGGPPVEGYVIGPTAMFLVSLGQGDPKQAYAFFKTTSGSPWQPIPNNESVSVTVSGASGVIWQYNVPQGVDFKFLLGPG
jgi:hypothetical protein